MSVEDFKIELLLHYARCFFVYSFNSRSELAVRTREALSQSISAVQGLAMPFRNDG
jgi:hypothetical protein